MFRYQRSILSLTNKSRNISVRFNSSVNNKLQLNNVTTPIEKEKSTSNEKKPEISFVPVISMPRTEFAHHSFFSLYRPLLGISAENETPFFSAKKKPEEEVEQEKLDMMLAVYMNDCIPFVEPSKLPTETQGEEWREGFLEAYQAAENEPETTQYTINTEVLEELKPLESSIPIFHMPESQDVLDYLTSMDLVSTQQFESEQDIFDHNSIAIQLPTSDSLHHHYHYHQQHHHHVEIDQQETMKGLKSTSKIPLNIGVLDNTLFVSTLTRTSTATATPIYYPKRRLSQPETQMISSSCSSSSSCTSTQSDIALSTELIRRFSSGSTTSTHDPGHVRDTMHSPYKQHNKVSSNEATKTENVTTVTMETTPPVWADPILIQQNPTRYERVKEYMKQHSIELNNPLPLLKPCVFYFSDTNSKQSYMSAVKCVFKCDTVWQFSSRWRVLKEKMGKKPSQLLANQNLFCFIEGVEPMWEDKVNEKGGRLVIQNTKGIDDVVERILCAFVGANLFQFGVVGIVVSRRNRGDRIELWLDESNCTIESIDLFKYVLFTCIYIYPLFYFPNIFFF
ncbi:hypothetical protein BD770DRAFT_313226 [Pilaira anomala]|nr:hypothetical protein BD770DRAFT_313226 [Pilaira anomala]